METYELQLLRAMVAAQQHGDEAVQDVVANALTAIPGVHVERVRYTPKGTQLRNEFAGAASIASGERLAVVGRWHMSDGVDNATQEKNGDEKTKRSLIMFAHPDGEDPSHAPPGSGPSSWKYKPFEATLDNGRVHGWAIADDIMGVAAGLCAMRSLHMKGRAPRAELIMASTPSKRHARGCAELVQRGYIAEAALYLHPAESGAGLQEVKAYTSGQLLVKVRVRGALPVAPTIAPFWDHPHWKASITPEGDGMCAFAFTAVNAIDKILLVRDALMLLGDERQTRVHHPTIHVATGRSTSVLVSSITATAKSLSSVPLAAELGAAMCFPPTESLQDVMDEVTTTIDACANRDTWLREHPPEIEFVSGVSGAEVSEDGPLYAAVSESIAEATGAHPHVNPLHTSSDIRVPAVQHGVPCVGFGSRSGNLAQNGLADEWIDLDDFMRFVRVLEGVIARWCGLIETTSAE